MVLSESLSNQSNTQSLKAHFYSKFCIAIMLVMAGLDPATHAVPLYESAKYGAFGLAWMPGTSRA
jgi:hypothetical protein